MEALVLDFNERLKELPVYRRYIAHEVALKCNSGAARSEATPSLPPPQDALLSPDDYVVYTKGRAILDMLYGSLYVKKDSRRPVEIAERQWLDYRTPFFGLAIFMLYVERARFDYTHGAAHNHAVPTSPMQLSLSLCHLLYEAQHYGIDNWADIISRTYDTVESLLPKDNNNVFFSLFTYPRY